MKIKKLNLTQCSVLCSGAVLASTALQAQPDYSPAIWNPPSCTKWYTSGYGHKFAVIHDMEGYYLSSVAYLNTCGVSASVYYAVNGKQDTSTDAPAGEVSQMCREANYAWHAACWNLWMYGTEHEGFASNPAWYTETMYQCSSDLQRHLANGAGIPKDRNHIVGHGEWQNSNWVNWMHANYPGINTGCNTHTDPGGFWNWSHFMSLINGTDNAGQLSKSIADGTSMTPGQHFTCSFTMTNNGSTAWIEDAGFAYTLNFTTGTQMSAPSVNFMGNTGNNIAPGGTYTFNVPMVAPSANGTYTANFQMNNTDAQSFGTAVHCTITVGGTPKVTNIVDNADSGFAASANWSTGSSSTDKYGSNYRFRSTAATSDDATWTANLSAGGSYKVFAWWPQGSNRSTTAPYIVTDSGGTAHTVNVNQQVNGGQWNLLGTYTLNSGNNTVKLSCWTATGSIVVADAIKFEQQ